MRAYKKSKLRLLKQFGVYLFPTDLQHLSELKTEIAIDNWCRTIIVAYLERYE